MSADWQNPQSVAPATTAAAAAKLDTLGWQRSYDRSTVDRFIAEVEAERQRLEAEIKQARDAADELRGAAEIQQGEVLAELGAMVTAARRECAAVQREHREIVAAIREAARVEAARIVAAAEREVAALRESSVALASLVIGGASRNGHHHPTTAGSSDVW